MKWDFEDKVAVITGAGKGIGAAVAEGVVNGGGKAAIFDVDAEAGKTVSNELGDEAQFFEADVTDRDGVAAALESTVAHFGGIDILVNNAGIVSRHTLNNMPPENWDRTVSINLTGVFNCTQAALPHIKGRGGGAIVNVCSISGYRFSLIGGVDYTSTKWAVRGFTRQSAFELAQYGIRVNAICPGPTLTPLVYGSMPQEEIEKAAKRFPLGDWVDPEDIANGVLFLASPAARMCTGIDLVVDAGFLLLGTQSIEEYMNVRDDVAVSADT